MPTYGYICENCGNEFEQFQSITSNPLKKCSECDKMKLKRLIGAGAGVIFKGSGFHQTDYRSDSYKADAKKDATPAPCSGCGKSKDCPAAKAESKKK